ncbi:reverse transcriptase domain-containing protein [Tanacetum coccineum]
MTEPEKTPTVPLEIESPKPYMKQPFIEELFVIPSKINMFEEKFETSPDSLLITIIDPDDQPMWSSTRIVTPTPSSAIVQLPIPNSFVIKGTITTWNEIGEAFISRYLSSAKFKRLLNEIHNFHQLAHKTFVDAWLRLKKMLLICYGHGLTKGTIIQILYHGLDDPTQGILNAGGIFIYKPPNEAFKFLEDKILLKLDFSKECHISPKLKTVVSACGSNTYSNHVILIEKFEALATKIDYEFLIIRKELKEMQDGRRDNHASQIYMSDDMPMCDPMEANYMSSHVGDEELNAFVGIGNEVLKEKEIKKDDMGSPKEPNKERKLN